MPHLTKITMPNLCDIVPRERLFSLLDEGLNKSVTWIACPAGSGKTSLVGSYLSIRNLPYLWYKIDPGDGDPATFFYYMGMAARKYAPRFRKPMPLLTPEFLPGIQAFTQRYFEELCLRLKPPFVIVFDNYQEVSGQPQLHEIINTAASVIPEGIHAIIISRGAPPEQFSRLRANKRIGLIGWDDIRLTIDETQRIVSTRYERDLENGELTHLHEKLEGWVAGLVLLMEGGKLQPEGFHMHNEFEPDKIFQYFASEAFHKIAPEMQDFLLRTSFLPIMTVPMAKALTGINTAGKILKGLHGHNYFTERRFSKEPTYLYHALFRKFLNTKAIEVLPDGDIAAIRQRAATVLMDAGQAEDAAVLLIEAGDWNRFIPFVLGQAPVLLSQGRSKTLEEWLLAVPEKQTGDMPWILYWKGVCALSSSPARSRVYFEQAFHLFEGKDDTGLFLAWSGAVNTFIYIFADFKPLDRWIDWLDIRLRENKPFPSIEIEACVAASMTGALIWRKPDHPDMKEWLNTTLTLLKIVPISDTHIRAYLDISLYHLWMGELTEAEMVIGQIKKMAAAESTSVILAIAVKYMEALFLNVDISKAEQAMQKVFEGFELGKKKGVHALDVLLMGNLLQCAINIGDLDLMQKYLTEMERMLPYGNELSSGLFYYLSAWFSLHLRDAPRAVILIKKSIQLVEQGGGVFSGALNRVILAIALCETGNYGEAIHELEVLEKLNKSFGSFYLNYLYHLIGAHIEFSRDNDKAGFKALKKALAEGLKKDDLTAMINFLRPDSMANLCAKALLAGIEVDHVQGLIRKLRLVPDDSSMELENWPWLVKIYTMGRFSLTVNGKKIQESRKAQKKPVLLLKALIALGGRDVKAEMLADILWPEADGDSGHNVFTTTLARLRKMIGSDRAIHLYDGRVTLDNRYCWVDKWVFERLGNRVEAMAKNAAAGNDLVKLKEMISKAMKLYCGHFLHSDIEEPWTLMPRKRLRDQYLSLIRKIGFLCEQTGTDEEAAIYYQKGLKTDPVAEEFYQALISAFIRMGRHAEAMITYQQCHDALKTELGIAPSSKTEALRTKISKGAYALLNKAR